MKKILPIGTVVKLNEHSDVKFMIVGYFPTNNDGEMKDYSAIRYPMGAYDNRMFFFFNETSIFEVLHEGLIDDEFKVMCAFIQNEKSLNKEGNN